jgi:hypothetical protein
MKITDKGGLDPATSYVSVWYGKKVGTSQTKLGGDGKIVCGIFGRKGLNVDALGLVMSGGGGDAGATDDSNKP